MDTQKFDGQLEVDGESGVVSFRCKGVTSTLFRVSNLPLPLPLLEGTDTLEVEIQKSLCNWTNNVSSDRSWWNKDSD